MKRISYIYMVTFLHKQYTVAISLEMRIQTRVPQLCISTPHAGSTSKCHDVCGYAVLELQEENGQETDKKCRITYIKHINSFLFI